MKKKILIVLGILLVIALCAVISTHSAYAATIIDSGYCGGEGDGDNLTWTLDSDGTLTISGTGVMNNWSSDRFEPWYSKRDQIATVRINNGVTSIGNLAFMGCANLTSITISDSVTSIGFSAFDSCSSLTSISIPDGITSIGGSAFASCDNLTTVTIPDSVTIIEDSLFAYCSSLTDISIPDSVTSINGFAFDSCRSLTSITIPDSVTSIGFYAFDNCSGLTSISIPDSVTSIGIYALARCSSLTDVTIPEGITIIDEGMFENCDSLTNIMIPNSVTSIGKYAFYGCDHLSDVYFIGTHEQWNDVTIGEKNDYLLSATIHYILAFGYCGGEGDGTNLTWMLDSDGVLTISGTGEMADYQLNAPWYSFKSSVSELLIGENVTSIGQYAFWDCSELRCISIGERITRIGEGAFSACGGLSEINYNARNPVLLGAPFSAAGTKEERVIIKIGDAVETIPDGLFNNLQGIISISLGNRITRIGNNAFSSCEGLSDIQIPESVTSIGHSAFYNCTGLTTVTIPKNVTSIGYEAFYNCTGLRSITIPEETVDIGYYAFCNCTGLIEINYNARNAVCGASLFRNAGSYGNGVAVTFGDTVEVIPERLFDEANEYAPKITSVIIGNGSTSIGQAAFFNCSSLTSITISENVSSIGTQAFSYCDALSVVNYNAVDATIAGSIFYGSGTSGSGVSVVFGNNVTVIPDGLFSGCGRVVSVLFGEKVSTIGDGAFSDCLGLTSLSIPEGVSVIGSQAFAGCSDLTSLSIPESVSYLGGRAFYGTDLSSVQYNARSVSEIAYDSDGNKCPFKGAGCAEGIVVSFGDSVEFIPNYLFAFCGKVKGVSFGNSLERIGKAAFALNSMITEISLPDSLRVIDDEAFVECSGLYTVSVPDKVSTIGARAFSGCSGLTTVSLGSTINYLGSGVFDYCDSLTTVEYKGTRCQWIQIEGRDAVNESLLVYVKGDHFWDGIDYQWLDDYSSVTAQHECEYCGEIDVIETVNTTNTTNATCTLAGITTYTATFTDPSLQTQTKTVNTPALGHDLVHHNAKMPTCTEGGWSAYDTCTRCDYTTFAEAPALGHAWGTPSYVWAADNSSVTATSVCSHDSNHTVSETAATVYTIIQEPTANADGSAKYTATFTNALFLEQVKTIVLPMLGHEFEFTGFVWVKTDAGYSVYANYKCKTEENHNVSIEAAVSSRITKEATCESAGTIVYTATVAASASLDNTAHSDTKTETIAALGHDIIHHEAKAPSCTEVGWKAYDSCTRCNYTTYSELPALGHSWADPVWTWAEDYSTASARFVCNNDNAHTEVLNASVTVVSGSGENAGTTVYTAAVVFEGKAYTDTKIVADTPALPIRFATSISLDDQIALNVYIGQLPSSADISDFTAKVFVDGKEAGTFSFSGLKGYTFTVDGVTSTYYYMKVAELAAKNMTDEYVVKVLRNGAELGQETFTIRGYCESRLKDGSGASAKNKLLCRATLTYGAEAQKHFNYKTDDLADKNIERVALTDIPADYAITNDPTLKGISKVGTSGSFEAQVFLNLYFVPESGYGLDDFTFSAKLNGKACDVTPAVLSNGYIHLKMPSVVAKDLGTNFEITVTNKTTGASSTWYRSAMNYAYITANGNASATMKNLVKALYQYYLASK